MLDNQRTIDIKKTKRIKEKDQQIKKKIESHKLINISS